MPAAEPPAGAPAEGCRRRPACPSSSTSKSRPAIRRAGRAAPGRAGRRVASSPPPVPPGVRTDSPGGQRNRALQPAPLPYWDKLRSSLSSVFPRVLFELRFPQAAAAGLRGSAPLGEVPCAVLGPRAARPCRACSAGISARPSPKPACVRGAVPRGQRAVGPAGVLPFRFLTEERKRKALLPYGAVTRVAPMWVNERPAVRSVVPCDARVELCLIVRMP